MFAHDVKRETKWEAKRKTEIKKIGQKWERETEIRLNTLRFFTGPRHANVGVELA